MYDDSLASESKEIKCLETRHMFLREFVVMGMTSRSGSVSSSVV